MKYHGSLRLGSYFYGHINHKLELLLKGLGLLQIKVMTVYKAIKSFFFKACWLILLLNHKFKLLGLLYLLLLLIFQADNLIMITKLHSDLP